MAKLTKAQRKAHAEAEAILTKDRLSEDEKDFVFQNWHEGANHINGAAGAFFTPYDLAADFELNVSGDRIIDLCAGIGVLSYFVLCRSRYSGRIKDLTCVEINPRYCEVGRKLLPEARWINADLFDWRDWWQSELQGETFDCAIGNPPFGNVRRAGNAPRYRGKDFEFHAIDIAAEMAGRGAFILPQQSASFRFSGSQTYRREESGKGVEFEKATGFVMEDPLGVDTGLYRNSWKDTSILTEIATFDFEEARSRKRHEAAALAARPLPSSTAAAQQLALL